MLRVTVTFFVCDRTDTQSSPAFSQCQHYSSACVLIVNSVAYAILQWCTCTSESVFTALDRTAGDDGVVRLSHSYAVRVGAISWRSDGDTVHKHLAALVQGHVLVCTVLQTYPSDP